MEFGKYKFELTLTSAACLPRFKGSSFRGLLGHALKRTVCALKHQACATCMLRSNCTYAQVFETAHAIPAPDNGRVSSPPNPLVLVPPLTERQTFAAGDRLDCTLILMGNLNQNLPYFVYAFDQMGKIGLGKKINGKRAGFTLDRVEYQGETIYSKAGNKLRPPDQLDQLTLVPWTQSCPERITLEIKTPLRITGKTNGPPDLPFDLLARSLVRRCTALTNTYGQGEPNLDYPGLIQTAARIKTMDNRLSWFDWQRYSARQHTKMFMGGLVGSATFEGPLMPFMPFLSMAEKVHAGKNTVFGLGAVKVITYH